MSHTQYKVLHERPINNTFILVAWCTTGRPVQPPLLYGTANHKAHECYLNTVITLPSTSLFVKKTVIYLFYLLSLYITVYKVLVWLSVWSEVQTVCMSHCHANISSSLVTLKSRLVLLFWYRCTEIVGKRRPCSVLVIHHSKSH